METGNCPHTSLTLVSFDDRFAFTCNGCRELGYGPCYTCHQKCNYHLHSECQLRMPTISHPLFAHSHFVLNQTNKSTNLCEACGTSLGGWRYVLTDISLHPCCANLPYTSNVNGELFVLSNEKLESSNMCCIYCRQQKGVKGWAYVSKRLNVGVHVKCTKDMRHQCWERNYYAINNHNDDNYEFAYEQRGLNQQQRRFRKRDIFLVLQICY